MDEPPDAPLIDYDELKREIVKAIRAVIQEEGGSARYQLRGFSRADVGAKAHHAESPPYREATSP
jgi:hypothetical protein